MTTPEHHDRPAPSPRSGGTGDSPRAEHEFVTMIAEADGTTSTLRYRGVALDELAGHETFGRVWGLLVDDDLSVTLPPAEMFPLPLRTGDVRADVQAALAQLAPVWGFRPLHDISPEQGRDQLARASVLAISFVAQAARGPDLPIVPQREVDRTDNVIERFLVRWRGEADPRHVAALDAYFVAAAEHGLNPSTITARTIASTGADVAACLSGAVAAISGPLHGGAPSRVLHMIQAAERAPDTTAYVRAVLDRGHRVMGFGHRVYRAEDPRARVVRETCRRLGAPLYEAARDLEAIILTELADRHPGHSIVTNLEYWAAVLLDLVEVPPPMFSTVFACARTAGWSAHILEQARTGRVIRPVARYVGHAPRPLSAVRGHTGT